MRKTILIALFALLAFGSVFAATAAVNLRPTQIDLSSATSESAVLVTVSGYTLDDARYRLYNGSNQYNCWDTVTSTYISATGYAAGPQVPGTPTTSSTWWIMFQRGNNNATAASYRDRLGTAYSANYMTVALPTATAIVTPVSITNSNVTFSTWNTYTQKYVILAYDATINGNLISATSSAIGTGAFDLKVETGTTIRRIEVRDYLNTLVESVTGTWPSGTPTPTISVNPATLTGFNYVAGAGPSTTQTFSISGSNLTANISIAASTDYEISLSQASGYTTPLTLTQSGGTVAATTIYVRLKAGLAAGNYNSEVITASSTGATNQTVTCSGSVSSTTPTISVNPATLTGFTYVTGSGPSATQTFSISGTNLTANISIAAPTNYEISLTQASGYTTPLTLTQTGGSVAATTVYVRLKAGLAAGDYNGELITASSTGATNQTVTCSGTVTPPVGPTTFLEENFNYTIGTALTDNGWNVTGTTSTPVMSVTDGSLMYPGYYAYGGNSTTLATSGQDVNHTFTAQSAGAIYASFLINVTSAQTGDYFLNLGGAAMGTSYYGRVFLKRDGATDNAFIGLVYSSGTGAVTQYTTTSYPYGSTILLVLKYQIVDGTLNDVVYLYVNPTPGAAEPAATLTSASGFTGALADLASIGSIGLRQGSGSSAAAVKVDGIRITNNWALLWAGTPPPTPVIQVTGELSPFACYAGSASEETQTYTLNGTDLQGGITITPREGFEVSLTGTDGDWHTTLVASGTFPKTIHVRMNAATAGVYEGNIVHTSPGATTVNLAISGEAFNPSVLWNNPASLPAFNTQVNTPTAAQSYTLSATNATGNLELTTAAPFQISTASSGPWGYTLSLAYNFNASVYVRFNPVSAGTFNGYVIHNTADATTDTLFVSGIATPMAGMAVDLFFSEYIEGSSNNKALEIFNGTGGVVDLSDYKVELYANGAATPGNTITLSGTLAHGDVYVIANAGANASILALADVTSTVTYYNGDDAVALKKISTDAYVDIFGMIGQDPGTAWTADGGYSTLDKTLVRKATITQGVSVNPTGHAAGDVTAFETLGTEWDLYPVDTITNLGIHTFTPTGVETVATPSFSPGTGVYTAPVSVTISTTTPGATIYYTTNGDAPSSSSTLYTAPVAISATTTLKAVAYKTGFNPSSIGQAIYTYPVNVANIAALRASAQGATVYRLTGEAVLTFQQANRNQKYVQDATGAIVIDDPTGIITSTYALYDGITGLMGTLGNYSSLIQFTPVANPGAATSHGNTVIPAVRTLATITTDDQAKLLKINNVTLDATTGNFAATAENINATDASGTGVLRSFPAADYAGTAIPATPVDIVCLGGQYGTTMQFSPRFLADITPAAGTLEAPILNITIAAGQVNISWAAVSSASGYRIESSNDPYTGFTTVTTTTGLTWSGSTAGMKFFRVIATN